MSKQNKAGIDIRFAKTADYKDTLETIIKTEKCPFCPDNFRYHKNPILKEHKDWVVTENSWPYKDTKHHFIFISEAHHETFSDLSDEDFLAIKHLMNWVIKKFDVRGGGFAFRFGEQKYTGATVHHLHAHLIVPGLDSGEDKAKTVSFPIG